MASETYIKHHKLNGDHNLQIPGYELIKVSNLSNQKKRWYFFISQIFSPSKSKQCKFFSESLNFDLNADGKYDNITLIYCSQSQSSDEFHTFNKIF